MLDPYNESGAANAGQTGDDSIIPLRMLDSRQKRMFNTRLIRVRPIIAQIAQSVEQGIENPRVGGSIPPLGTILFLKPGLLAGLFYC